MKIIMVTQFFHPHIGGIERHVLHVAKDLIEREDEVRIITWRYDNRLPEIEEIEGVNVHRILDEGWYGGTLRRLRGWRGMWASRKIWMDADAIHFHDYTPLIEWYLPFLVLNRRIFITFHGYEGYPIPRFSILLRRFSHLITRDAICAGDYIPAYYGTSCRYVTYGGVEIDARGSPGDRRDAVFLGSLRRDTGILGYIEALSILKSKWSVDLVLNIIGDGPLREQVITLAGEKGVQLEFHGLRPDPAPFLASSRVALVDSYLAILESMAMRTPVFSYYDNPLKKDYLSCFPASGEIIGIRKDPEKLAMDLRDYFERPDTFEERIERGFAFAREQTWRKVADLYRNLYAS